MEPREARQSVTVVQEMETLEGDQESLQFGIAKYNSIRESIKTKFVLDQPQDQLDQDQDEDGDKNDF